MVKKVKAFYEIVSSRDVILIHQFIEGQRSYSSDYVYFSWNNGIKRQSRVKEDRRGYKYFKSKDIKFYLDEFITV